MNFLDESNEEDLSKYDEPFISESINTPDFTNIGINEEMIIYRDTEDHVKNRERSINECYEKIFGHQQFEQEEKTSSNETKSILDPENFISDFIDFKEYIIKKVDALSETVQNFDTAMNIDFEKEFLKSENSKMKEEILDLREMVKDLVGHICSNNKKHLENENIESNHFKNIVHNVKRRNQSTVTNQQINKYDDTNVEHEYNKWLIPKRPLTQYNVKKNKKLETSNRYTTLYLDNLNTNENINDANESYQNNKFEMMMLRTKIIKRSNL